MFLALLFYLHCGKQELAQQIQIFSPSPISIIFTPSLFLIYLKGSKTYEPLLKFIFNIAFKIINYTFNHK